MVWLRKTKAVPTCFINEHLEHHIVDLKRNLTNNKFPTFMEDEKWLEFPKK